MQSPKTTHISPSEWRWVLVVGGVLTALTLLPYAWALAVNATATDWRFMGILANPQDGASYLAKIGQGMRGAWLIQFMHTPEPHTGAVIQVLYPLLGHIAHLLNVSNLFIFHVGRVLATLFMFIALYQFGATVWVRPRPRRLFFILVSVSSGLGWLLLLLDSGLKEIPDLTVPEAYPLYAAYANPHFPLVIGCLALLAAFYVTAFRIDFRQGPTVSNGGLSVFLLTLVAALVLPQALVPFGAALIAYVVMIGIRQRIIPVRELRWVGMFALPAVLMAAYYYAVVTYHPIMDTVWNKQVSAESASPLLMLTAYGLLLIVALPGLARAVRHFEEDGDRLMLIWLVVNFLLIFVPFNQQRRFMTGLIIPVTFFAVRSLEDYWLVRIPERLHTLSLGVLVVFLIPSNLLTLGIPLFGLLNPEAGLEQRLILQIGYGDALDWLAQNGQPDDVVLASPNVSLWIPPYSGRHVVYGHPWESVNAPAKLAQVEDFFSGRACYWPTVERDGYSVRYVLVGPQEREYSAQPGGSDACIADLETVASRVATFGDVFIYQMPVQDQ